MEHTIQALSTRRLALRARASNGTHRLLNFRLAGATPKQAEYGSRTTLIEPTAENLSFGLTGCLWQSSSDLPMTFCGLLRIRTFTFVSVSIHCEMKTFP